jgi:predicted alpha/beta superfamily hydrolase
MTIPAPDFIETAPPLTGGCRTLRLTAEPGTPSLNLWINTPQAARPPLGWPALILLDAEAYFTASAEMAQRLARRTAKTRIEPMMIVGVSLDEALDRHAAYRFSHDDEASNSTLQGRQLLHRLVYDVLPLVEAEGAARSGLTLMGHSMSGLFVLEARAAGAPFARFVAISPSIWGHPSVIMAQPSGPARTDDMLVIVGGQEETEGLSPLHLGRRMISNARTLLDRGGVQFSVLDDEDHGSTPYASLPAALRFASKSPASSPKA